MANCSEGFSQQATEVNFQNLKGLADRYIALMAQGAEDNQANSRAWNAFNLSVAQDAQKVKYFAELAVLQAGQTGMTENQQTVSPEGTATAEAIKGGVGVSAEQVAANISALSDVVVKFAELMSTLVAQVQPRSPAAASPTPAA